MRQFILLTLFSSNYAFFGGRTRGELKSEVLFTPKKCHAKVAYGDQAFIHYKVWKKNQTHPDQFEEKYFDRSAHDKPYRFPVGMEYRQVVLKF